MERAVSIAVEVAVACCNEVEIRQSLHDFGVDFDVYFHEDSLHESSQRKVRVYEDGEAQVLLTLD